jgi:hypothetical protein
VPQARTKKLPGPHFYWVVDEGLAMILDWRVRVVAQPEVNGVEETRIFPIYAATATSALGTDRVDGV